MQHTADPSNRKMRDWIRSLKQLALKPLITILDDNVPERDIKHAEQDAIAVVKAVRGDSCLNKASHCNSKIRLSYIKEMKTDVD
jgi:hypothetical protein